MIRVILPGPLRTLAKLDQEVSVECPDPTIRGVLDALEAKHPVLGGTIRDHVTKKRRDFVRFFVCGEDWSHEPVERALPEPVVCGVEPFLIVGAMAGG